MHLKFIYSIFIDTHTQIKNPKHVDEEDKDNLPEGESGQRRRSKMAAAEQRGESSEMRVS